MHHYTDSGLDNVFLVNGYHEHKTAYGVGVSIDDLDGLHKVIGRWLVNFPKPLVGAEFRFLRHELELSQKKLGRLMGVKELTVGRWERAREKPVDSIADRLIRIIYMDYLGNKSVRDLIEGLADLDEIENAECRVVEKGGKWRLAETACAA